MELKLGKNGEQLSWDHSSPDKKYNIDIMDLTFPIKKKYRLKKKYTVKYKVIPIVTEGSETILSTFERYLSKLGETDVQVGTYATAALVTE